SERTKERRHQRRPATATANRPEVSPTDGGRSPRTAEHFTRRPAVVGIQKKRRSAEPQSAGSLNSIRHNLSLHSRFMRIQNEGAGKSSWWVINPDAKPGRNPRRVRASTLDTTSKVRRLLASIAFYRTVGYQRPVLKDDDELLLHKA
ncbi:hypothetical protein OSTOST_13753, partial [Ostertagia ostertagi]